MRSVLLAAPFSSNPEARLGSAGAHRAPFDESRATYQVIINRGGRELSMYLPPTATDATIPGEFLEPATATGGELLAREKSGNQTISELPSFRTR